MDCYDEILNVYKTYGRDKDKKETWACKYINFLIKRTMNAHTPINVTNCLILTLNLLLRDAKGLDNYPDRGKTADQLTEEERKTLFSTLKKELNS